MSSHLWVNENTINTNDRDLVNGQVEVPAGGQIKVPAPCGNSQVGCGVSFRCWASFMR
jgi:hypothetical protein